MLSASWPHLFQRRVAEARRFLRFWRKGVHCSWHYRVSSRIITALRGAVIMEVAEAELGAMDNGQWKLHHSFILHSSLFIPSARPLRNPESTKHGLVPFVRLLRPHRRSAAMPLRTLLISGFSANLRLCVEKRPAALTKTLRIKQIR